MNVDKRIKEATARMEAAQHGMQAGVKMTVEAGDAGQTNVVHLRVGVNSALVFQAGLANLLVRKGIITETELAEAMADAMEAERLRYEILLRKQFDNPNIHLA